MPPSPEIPAKSSVGRQHSPDRQEPGSQSKPIQHVGSRSRQPDVYRLPYQSLAAQRLMQNPGRGVQIELSEDGLWLIVRPYQSSSDMSEPLLGQGKETPSD
ncbi:hypothetical protein [Fibrisoma limi]|uniref:hypothetical protein n=1 Tax=Fibrisoma limi TaxID=663275 RepID=UPI0005867FE2|nr:hypothetical protein [Fibrisoma limi]